MPDEKPVTTKEANQQAVALLKEAADFLSLKMSELDKLPNAEGVSMARSDFSAAKSTLSQGASQIALATA